MSRARRSMTRAEVTDANRVSWDAAARGTYRSKHQARIAALRSGSTSLQPVEARWAKQLSAPGASLVHLQCADGFDTLSFRRQGFAEVTGVDFAAEMIALARDLAARTGTPARFVQADVLELPAALDATADVVYTGKGAIMWVADLEAWARGVHRLLRPGGAFLLWDLHPAFALLSLDSDGGYRWNGRDYFGGTHASRSWPNHYGAPGAGPLKVERIWPVAAVIQSLLNAGLRLEALEEHTECYFPAAPADHAGAARLPQTMLVVARRPTGPT